MQDKNGVDVDVESTGESECEMELNVKGRERGEPRSGSLRGGDWMGGIQVQTDVDLTIEQVRQEIAREVQRQSGGDRLRMNGSHSNFGR